MEYQSSRGGLSSITAAEAIKMGLAPDGGLFVPDFIPTLDNEDWQVMQEWTYQQRACRLMSFFLEDFTRKEIESCVYGAYNRNNFDHKRIAPLVQLNDNTFIQELWHGPTCAFKDMALQILPRLLTVSTRKTGETAEIVILVATSGDTGKAALEGFKDVDGTRIIVFFPRDGVSEVQKRQMVTQEGSNVYVAAVEGNFDDAQNGVKNIFSNDQIKAILTDHNLKLSSANSINWGRLLPQIIYYVSAYLDLMALNQVAYGEPVNIVVPTGNFGNILAAYYAGRMGVPINRLICASNANNVLTEFLRTGVYNRNRRFYKTISPSMDILISSNLERLLYEITGHDAQLVSGWMQELKENGVYQVNEKVKTELQKIFWADYGTDEETIATIRSTWEGNRYLLDTHTAVAVNVYQKYVAASGDNHKTIIASTASPFKFGPSVAAAVLKPEVIAGGRDEFELLEILAAETGNSIPPGIKDLDKRAIRHQTVSSREDMAQTVLNFLNL
ncbi:MAG: threonine synthase [Syntrophomonadaceae bacterium]